MLHWFCKQKYLVNPSSVIILILSQTVKYCPLSHMQVPQVLLACLAPWVLLDLLVPRGHPETGATESLFTLLRHWVSGLYIIIEFI